MASDFDMFEDMVRRYIQGRSNIDPVRLQKQFNVPEADANRILQKVMGENLDTISKSSGIPKEVLSGKNNIVDINKTSTTKQAINSLNFETDMAKKMAKEGVKETAKKGLMREAVDTGIGFIPYVGDVYDIGRGLQQTFNGHPIAGLGQAGLGALALGLNAFVPGTGTAVKAVKTGAKGARLGANIAKASRASRALQATPYKSLGTSGKVAKALHSGYGQAAMASIPEFFYADWTPEEEEPNNLGNSSNSSISSLPPTEGLRFSDINVQPSKIGNIPLGNSDEFIRGLVANNGINTDNNQGNTNIQGEATQSPVNESLDIEGILDLYKQQQANLEPYRKGLEDLINNYNDMKQRQYLNDAFNASFAGWSKNPAYTNLIGRYDPAKAEAERLTLMNDLINSLNQGIGDKYKMEGGAELAKELGMNPKVAFASPELINKFSNLAVAQTNAQARRDVQQMKNDFNAVDHYLDRALKKAKAEGDWENAIKLQRMKDNNNLQRSVINATTWGNQDSISNLRNVLRYYGYDIPFEANSLVDQIRQLQEGE